ncbi:hypothetical protein BpHYR1_027435 [Brachionus plicatilis]|uniref:Uncharacterized protein n=1 Tax=Brachionus plicatilis TaxID=10195 RepID=A0A3M7RW02_BRAPC|nr:hypothetical protein BpHYR1_027435 [Brachionus plicatilis]
MAKVRRYKNESRRIGKNVVGIKKTGDNEYDIESSDIEKVNKILEILEFNREEHVSNQTRIKIKYLDSNLLLVEFKQWHNNVNVCDGDVTACRVEFVRALDVCSTNGGNRDIQK